MSKCCAGSQSSLCFPCWLVVAVLQGEVSTRTLLVGLTKISPRPPPNARLGNENLILQPAVVGARVEKLCHAFL